MTSALSWPRAYQALAQRFRRGRQDEDADRIGDQPAHLRCALPVDLQQDVLAVARRSLIQACEVP